MPALRPLRLPAEILDSLSADDPAARSSRRDLRIFNRTLGNEMWIRRIVPGLVRSGERVVEIGAGDGRLGLTMGRDGVAWDAVDLAPRPEAWPADAEWRREDLRTFVPSAVQRVVVGNLIFHHFDAEQLHALGGRLQTHARVIVAGELRRGRVHEWLFAAFARLVGAHRVSLHDGKLSIRAGFRGDELPQALGLDAEKWTWTITSNVCGAYRMLAVRRT